MPGEVRSAGGPGSPCCLFWPLAGVQSQRADTQQVGVWQQVTGNPFVQYIALAATVRAQLLNHSVVLFFLLRHLQLAQVFCTSLDHFGAADHMIMYINS